MLRSPAPACAHHQEGDQQDVDEPTLQQQQKKPSTRRAEVALHLSVTFVVSVSSCSVCRWPVKLETDPQNKEEQRSLPVSPERNSSGYSNPIIQPWLMCIEGRSGFIREPRFWTGLTVWGKTTRKTPHLKAEEGEMQLKYKVGSCRGGVNKWQCYSTQAAPECTETKVGWFPQDLHLLSPLSPISPNLKAFEGVSETHFPSHSQICLNLTCRLNSLWSRTEKREKTHTSIVISHTLLYYESSVKLSLCRVRLFWTESPFMTRRVTPEPLTKSISVSIEIPSLEPDQPTQELSFWGIPGWLIFKSQLCSQISDQSIWAFQK